MTLFKRRELIMQAASAPLLISLTFFGTKKGTGSSGVPLRYHPEAEYDLLDRGQKDELREWRQVERLKGGKGKAKDVSSKKGKFDTTKAIASAVEKKVAEKMKAMEQEKTNGDEAEAYIMSIFKKFSAASKAGQGQIYDVTVEPTSTASVTAPTLKSILKRAKNTKTGT
jgi:chorismate mutase